jgi:hypothetical protein
MDRTTLARNLAPLERARAGEEQTHARPRQHSLFLWTLRGGGSQPPGVQLLIAYFSLSRAWIPCVFAWDPETGEFRRVEGPEGFTTSETSRRVVGCTRASGRGSPCRAIPFSRSLPPGAGDHDGLGVAAPAPGTFGLSLPSEGP